MAKDLSTLTPEQLMELAKNPIKEPRKNNLSPVKEFIVSEDIIAGDTKVNGVIIYDRYKRWCKNNSIKTLSMSMFFTEFKFHFKKVKSNGSWYYMLNQDGFDMSPETLKILNSAYRKRISRGAKAKKVKEENSQEG